MDRPRSSIGTRGAAWALTALLLAVGCSSDSSDETEPPADAGGDAATDGPAGEVSSSGGGLSVVEGVGASSLLTTGVPGLTVRRVVTTKTTADRAVVVVVPETSFGPGGPEAVAAEDRRKVLDALAAANVDAGAVDFGLGQSFEGARVAVTVAVGEVATRGPQIIEAVEGVVGRAEQSGVTFSVEDCGPVLAGLRQRAFADAEAEKRSWAESTPARPGPVVAVSSSTAGSGSGLGPVDPCRPGDSEPARRAPVQPLDSPAEVEIRLQLAVTYALGPTPAPDTASQVSAVGTGTVEAKADEAYVVVVAGFDEEGDSQPLSGRDRDQLVTAVAGLGHDREDVEVVGAPDDPAVTLVQVEVDVGDVEKEGRAIVTAVEEVLGRSDTSGVRFGREDCASLLARARKDAAADGRTQAAALAESAGARVGELRALTDLGSPSGVPPCSDDARELFAAEDIEYGYGPSLEAFDAEPTFELTTRTAVSYSLAR